MPNVSMASGRSMLPNCRTVAPSTVYQRSCLPTTTTNWGPFGGGGAGGAASTAIGTGVGGGGVGDGDGAVLSQVARTTRTHRTSRVSHTRETYMESGSGNHPLPRR